MLYNDFHFALYQNEKYILYVLDVQIIIIVVPMNEYQIKYILKQHEFRQEYASKLITVCISIAFINASISKNTLFQQNKTSVC